ncbi:MAG: cbb3-type cytochrome oxidase assembly protein [ANME-2 cluster archaeon]|nr:cbb3-type cytochrome oxidase assembly protein [ANME-2 cluster archaeon]
MNDYGLALFLSALCMLLIFLGFLLWGIRSGQFTDVESSKYRMLDIEVENEVNDREDRL